MRQLRSMALVLTGMALGWVGNRAVGPRRHDRELIASVAAVRAEIEALARRVPPRPQLLVSPAPVVACPPVAGGSQPPIEAPGPSVDGEAFALAEGLVNDALAGGVWTEAHRDRWMALSGQLDRATRDRLGQALERASERRELQLETGEGLAF